MDNRSAVAIMIGTNTEEEPSANMARCSKPDNEDLNQEGQMSEGEVGEESVDDSRQQRQADALVPDAPIDEPTTAHQMQVVLSPDQPSGSRGLDRTWGDWSSPMSDYEGLGRVSPSQIEEDQATTNAIDAISQEDESMNSEAVFQARGQAREEDRKGM